MVLCAAYGCNTDSGIHRISMFKFPSEPKRRKLWIDRLNRGQSATKKFAPNHHSKVCVKHFEDSQFIISPKFAEQIGFGSVFRVRLKPDAVPTIFDHPRQKPSKERPSATAIVGKKLKHEIKSTINREKHMGLETVPNQFLDDGPFTAIPLCSVYTTSTTASVVTTTAVSSNMCQTVRSNHCPLTWFADVTSSFPKLQVHVPTIVISHNPVAQLEHSYHQQESDIPICEEPNSQAPRPVQVNESACQFEAVEETCYKVESESQQSNWHLGERGQAPVPVNTPVSSVQVFSVQTQTPYNLVKRRSAATQCAQIITVDQATQTKPIMEHPGKHGHVNESLNDSIFSVESNNDPRDPDWEPDEEDSECEMEVDQNTNDAKESKYIVFDSCLDRLLDQCSLCGSKTCVDKKTVGTCLVCEIKCLTCDNVSNWRSQPMSGNLPTGNLILSAAIMFSGSSPVQYLRALNFAGIQNISMTTFNTIQSAYLTPSVLRVWNRHQEMMFGRIRREDRNLRLAGDMRCCTPGHTAKYGSYSVIDLEVGQVLDFQLVQSNEVRNSHAMELEGLKRTLNKLIETNSMTVTDLITDRHSAVKKFMREEKPDIKHWFDVWHVAKGVYKKLEAAGKKKGCQKVKDWARSISNHMYWCAASSSGDGELVQQKWLSILNHVANIHEGHGDKFKRCEHPQLEDRDWMKKGYKPYAEMEKIVKGRLLVQDVKRLSPSEQTSSLESFHNVVCHFASKSVHYFYAQMEARLALAALHFNENAGRRQAVTKEGHLQWKISFPKARHGEAIAKEVKTQQTFAYIDELMECILEEREKNKSYLTAKKANSQILDSTPKPLTHSTPRPRKEDVVRAHRARFNK